MPTVVLDLMYIEEATVITEIRTEAVNCPFCGKDENYPYHIENGYTAVKCIHCGLIYVNPRPLLSMIDESVTTGVHRGYTERTAIGRRVGSKIRRYRSILRPMFADVWERSTPISWLDVGAGFGEFIQAVSMLAPSGSNIVGLEPMHPKVKAARERGLNVHENYLSEVEERFDFISLINVFSHIPNFREFLGDLKKNLYPGSTVFIETGNIGDLQGYHQVPTELDIPDHLVFSGERHIIDWLRDAGFSIVDVRKKRKDGIVNFGKTVVKRILGRQVTLAVPYTSQYRTMFIRAKLQRESFLNAR